MPLFGRSTPSQPMHGYNFTERVRRVLASAREEAGRLHHEYVGTEHILLAIVGESDSTAAAILDRMGIDRPSVRGMVDATVKPGKSNHPTGPDLPYTSRAKKVLELAMAEARELDHSYVGTEHLLLGLLREESGIGAQVLREHGASVAAAREELRHVHGQRPARTESGIVPLPVPPRPSPPTPSLADRGREDLAWSRLRNALDASARLGGPVTATLQEDGSLLVSLGPELVVSVEFPPSVGLRRRDGPAAAGGEPPAPPA